MLVKGFVFCYLKTWINGQKHWLDCVAQSGDMWTVFTGKGPWHLYGFKENKCRRCNQRVYSSTLFLHWKGLDITCNLCILHTYNSHKMLCNYWQNDCSAFLLLTFLPIILCICENHSLYLTFPSIFCWCCCYCHCKCTHIVPWNLMVSRLTW